MCLEKQEVHGLDKIYPSRLHDPKHLATYYFPISPLMDTWQARQKAQIFHDINMLTLGAHMMQCIMPVHCFIYTGNRLASHIDPS